MANEQHLKEVRDMYGRRAASYDASNGGWHVELAQDFVKWLNPQPGEQALDLACGTGLVTISLAAAVGPSGKVIGVDMTAEMMDIGKTSLQAIQQSATAASLAPVHWVEMDITSPRLLDETAVKAILEQHGGFDIISVCSAFLLLPDPAAALRFWVQHLLRKGGRIITDVPTEDITLQLLVPTYIPDAIGLSSKFSDARHWIHDQQSLASLFESLGLQVEQNIRTRSYLEEKWYPDTEEAMQQVLEMELKNTPVIEKRGKSDEVRKIWPEVWPKAVRMDADGNRGATSAYWLYVSVGRKI